MNMHRERYTYLKICSRFNTEIVGIEMNRKIETHLIVEVGMRDAPDAGVDLQGSEVALHVECLPAVLGRCPLVLV